MQERLEPLDSEQIGVPAGAPGGASNRDGVAAGIEPDPGAVPLARAGEWRRLKEIANSRGTAALDESALVGLIVGRPCGAPDELVRLARSAPADLARGLGIGGAAALRLAAAFDLGRRVERARLPRRPTLRSAERVYAWMEPELRGLDHESFHALLLDGKHRLRRWVCVSAGTLTTSLVHPREFFGPAVRECAAAVIAVHNHPSGDPDPSIEDLEVTRRLGEVGRLLGIPLLDHVVVGDRRYVSLRARIAW